MGQEIAVTPLQLAGMVSAIANDGVLLPARIVAGTTQPQNTPQLIAFHPGQGLRVVAPLTAAQMKQMMQGVVLHGTGKKAILEGYSSAGKTGTAQKIDPATHTYSRTKYIASFAGFAPVNNPAITVVVILDSPIGGHHGGEVGAPVFNRVAQQVLEYMHAPHDVDLPANRLLLAKKVKDQDLEEGSPDRLGDTIELADTLNADVPPPPTTSAAKSTNDTVAPAVISASMRTRQTTPAVPSTVNPQVASGATNEADPKATVVLDVEQGGIVVPSFLGHSIRSAIELAENNGVELEALGSGVAREQVPPPGSRVTAGARITVKFQR
jgi:cell division protein FtsI (penicillin-binding protein 3)